MNERAFLTQPEPSQESAEVSAYYCALLLSMQGQRAGEAETLAETKQNENKQTLVCNCVFRQILKEIESDFLQENREKRIQGKMAVDPRDISHLFKLMRVETRRKYFRIWTEFVEFSGISVDVVPTEDHFMDFLVNRREEQQYSGNSLWSTYSALNTTYTTLYKLQLKVSCW